MTKPGDKVIFERRDKCPWCSKLIHTRVVRVTLTKSVPGQTEIQGFLEKDTQTTLEAAQDLHKRGLISPKELKGRTLEQDYQDEFSPPKKRGRPGKR